MHIMRGLATICLLAASTQIAFAVASDTEINTVSWPEKTECTPCISVQMDALALGFSPTALSRVTTFGKLPGLHLFGADLRDRDNPLSIIRLETEPLVVAAQELGILSDRASPSIAEVLDTIARLTAEDERRPPLQKLFGLDRFVRATRSETSDMLAYSFWNTESEIGKVLVVLPGCDSIACNAAYEIHGPISQHKLSNLIGSLERRPPP